MSKSTVLIVDDSTIIHRSLKRILGVADYQYISAFDVDDALKKYNSCVDLVICDLRMPGHSSGNGGFEVVAAIKKQTPDVPVIVITAYHTPENEQLAYSLGANLLLTKPINPTLLIDSITQFINKEE